MRLRVIVVICLGLLGNWIIVHRMQNYKKKYLVRLTTSNEKKYTIR